MIFSDSPLLHWLFRITVEGGLLILLVLAVRRAFPRLLTPAWHVVCWAIVGLKLLLPASLPVGIGFGEVLRADTTAPGVPAVVHYQEPGRPRLADETRGEGAPALRRERAPVDAASVFLALWAAGIVGVLALLLMREMRFRRSLARLRICDDRELRSLARECAAISGITVTPGVRLLPEGCGPGIAGLVSPVLLLPADWRARFDRDSLRHIIFHELEHLRGHDLVWNWIAALITAVHWFNPLVWLAASRFQSDRELRADARAIERMAPAERVAYGRTLLRISESFLAPPATAGLASCVRHHPSLRHRLTMITRPPTSSPMLHALSAGALGLLVCLSFGAARAQEEPGKERAAENTLSCQLGEPKPAARDEEKAREGERVRDGARPRAGERDAQRPKEGERMRDGDRPKAGLRDGEAPRTGPRDGDKPRTGERDGDRQRTGPRDEGGRKAEGERGASRERGVEREGGAPIEIHVLGQGDEVKIGEQTVPLNQLRGFLQGYLADKRERPVLIDADPSTPYSAVAGVLDAARDNGAKGAQIRGTQGRGR